VNFRIAFGFALLAHFKNLLPGVDKYGDKFLISAIIIPMAKPIVLEELSSPGCQHCAAFRAFWHMIEKDWPNVTYKEVSLITPEGQKMVSKFMIFASPGIILNGELFSTGGVNQKEFVEKLKELSKE